VTGQVSGQRPGQKEREQQVTSQDSKLIVSFHTGP
jgi:hypothetical protein